MSTGIEHGDEAVKPLRADAARNRQLILQAATTVFAVQGLDAGYDEIARRACVGVGTVYRRFPERAELIEALFESEFEAIVSIAEEATLCATGWEGLAYFLEQNLERQVVNRGLKELMFSVNCGEGHHEIARDRIRPLVDVLINRAQAEGSLRHDIGATDLGMQVMIIGSITTAEQPHLWRRYLALLLDGLRARPDQGTLPLDSPPEDQMELLMASLGGRTS